MKRFVLRQVEKNALSMERTIQIVRAHPTARIIAGEGPNLLIELDVCHLAKLRRQLYGWLVAPQGRTIPVPDTRLHIAKQ